MYEETLTQLPPFIREQRNLAFITTCALCDQFLGGANCLENLQILERSHRCWEDLKLAA